MNVEQLKKQAKELVRAARAGDPDAVARLGDLPVQLASAQLVLVREHGYSSWPALVRVGVEQPFHTDLEYYEGRADGIATVNGMSVTEARRDLAGRHGFSNWAALRRHVRALADGEEPPTPFMLAYRALESDDLPELVRLLDANPELVEMRGTNGNDLFGMANGLELTKLLLERGADVNTGNDYGWTKLHQAGYGNDPELARLLLDAGARTDLSARGDGGTPLIVALFWGHREVTELLGLEPGNLRVAAGLGRVDLIDDLAGTSAAGAPMASTGRTGASRRGRRPTIRRRSWTRPSSGRRRRTGWRRSTGSPGWAPGSMRIPTAARRCPGLRPTDGSPRSAAWSSSAPTSTSRPRSAVRAMARASTHSISPRRPASRRR